MRRLSLIVALAGLFAVGLIAQGRTGGFRINGIMVWFGLASVLDGTSGAPSINFASEPTLGIFRSGAATLNIQATNTTLSGNLIVAASGGMTFSARTQMVAPALGTLTLRDTGSATGSHLKFDALPTVSSCGAGSPAVVTGSTPFSGAVTIGTTSVATCLITFNGTAFPSAPHCSGSVETTTAANARAMGYSATVTALTIVPATAWADSAVVNWTCVSAK